MRKFFITLSILIFSNSAFATNELWTAATQSNLDDARIAGDTKYTQFKTKVDANSCSNDDYGLQQAIMFKATGTTSYCDTSFTKSSGCDGTANRNKTRDCFVERALAYSICADVVSAGNKATWTAQLDAVLALTQATNHGTRTGDTDELNGHYFGGIMYCLAKDGDLTNCSTAYDGYTGTTKNYGGVDATGDNTTTLRNAIYHYYTNLSGGSFVEGSEYNLNTLYYALQGVNAINDFYGVDKFPEITSLFDDMANFHVQYHVPNFSRNFDFGDTQSYNTTIPYRSRGLYAAMSHFDSDNANMRYLWEQQYTNSCVRMGWLMFYDHDATQTAPSGQTDYYADGTGIQLWHSGWADANESFYASQMKDQSNADHDANGWSNFNLWRQGNWAVFNGKGYYGSLYAEANYLNTVLISGGLPYVWQEARGSHYHEEGVNYAYQVGLTGGNSMYSSYFNPPPESLHYWARSHFYYHHADGSDTIIVFDNINAENPINLSNYSRHTATMQAFINGTAGKHRVLFFASSNPTQSTNRITWTADNAETVYLDTFMPSYTYGEENMNGAACSGCGGNMGTSNSTLDYRITLDSTSTAQHQAFGNILHAGSTPTVSEISITSGETAKGYMVESGTENLVVIFNGQNRTADLPAPTVNVSGQTKDPNKFNQLKVLHLFETGFGMTITTDGDASLFIVDLNPALAWEANIDGAGYASIDVSDAGLYTTTLSGASSHTVYINNTGASAPTCTTDWTLCTTSGDCTTAGWYWNGSACLQEDPGGTCNDTCSLCLSQGTCEASAVPCYWWLTTQNCQSTVAPNCADDPSLCTTPQQCVTAGWVYCNDTCQSSSSSGVIVGDYCNCSANDVDTISCACTVTERANQMMVISVGNEETGDLIPNSVTWNGDSATLIDSHTFWFSTTNDLLYYLLNPDVGTYSLTVTYDSAASVDPVIGMHTFGGIVQQAPEAYDNAEEDVAITTITNGALLVSNITSVAVTDFTVTNDLTTKAWERDNSGMSSALGYAVAGAAGSYNCDWNDTQASGDRSGTVCAAFEVAAECVNTTTPITSTSSSIGGGFGCSAAGL